MSYAPGVTNQSGQILAQGISQAGQSLGETIEQLGQRHRQLKAYQTMAVDGLGMDKDQVGKMTLPQLTGIMQGEALKSARAQREALTAETQAKTTMLQQNAEEADAFGKIAPLAQRWAANNPGKQPAATDILGWMGQAKLNPRTQSAIMQKLIPGMMNGEGTPTPQNWRSAGGNSYVTMGKQILPDRSAVNPDDVTPPAGYEAVPDAKGNVKYLRTPGQKTIPPAAQQQLTTYLNDYTSANDVLKASDDELKANPAGLPPAQLRAAATTRLKRTQQNAKNLLDLQKKLGALDDDTHQSFLSNFGLGNAPASAGGDGAVTPDASGRIPVWDKTGKKFTVPAAQKDQAAAGGYSLTPPQ